MVERTLGIIKPDAVRKKVVGRILARIEESGLRVVALKSLRLSVAQARAFYAVHAARPFYNDLVEFMTSGPVVVLCIEGENAIARWREIMGATDPARAAAGTLRRELATSIQENAVHGSDGPDTAAVEVPFFFSTAELLLDGNG